MHVRQNGKPSLMTSWVKVSSQHNLFLFSKWLCYTIIQCKYSRDPNSGHSKSGFIQKPDIYVRFSNGTTSLGRFIYTKKKIFIIKWPRLVDHSKTGRFCPVFEWSISLSRFLYTKYFYLHIKRCRLMVWQPSCFWTIQKPDHSKTGPFENRTHFEHLNTGHVRSSDPHCITLVTMVP